MLASRRALTAAVLSAQHVVRVPLTPAVRRALSTTTSSMARRRASAVAEPMAAAWRGGLIGHARHLQALHSVLAPRYGSVSHLTVRCMCATPNTKGGAAGDEAAKKEGDAEEDPNARPMRILDAEEEEVSRPKAVATLTLQLALAAGALYLLYQTIKVLMPTKMSTVNFFNRCSDTVRADPDVVSRFGGEIKSYGADHNTRRQGRRGRIPEYRYTKDNVDYLRIIFNIEGPSGVKGKVYAEIRSDQPDKFHYLIVEKVHPREIMTLYDNRSPVKPKHVRQSETAIALQSLRATLYGSDAEEDTLLQKRELGEHINLIRFIKCDENPYECTSNGITKWPSWTIEGKLHEGFQELEKLEKICEDLKHRTMVTA